GASTVLSLPNPVNGAGSANKAGSGTLVLSGANSFSGRWSALAGVLVGAGTSSFGTNTITVANIGAMETTYDVHNPNGDLVIIGNGQVFLNQNDTFHSVFVGGFYLSPGTYPFATLNAS